MFDALIRFTFLGAVLCGLSATASAQGNHYGWCNGVGNPHQSASCGGSETSGSTTGINPANVPTANSLPTDPNTNGPSPGTAVGVIHVPATQTVITGTGQVVPPTGTPGPGFTGSGLPPIEIAPLPQTVFTGTNPVQPLIPLPTPSFTGTGQLPIIVIPQAPGTLTGYGPVQTVTAIPTPSFTGTSPVPIVIVPQPPGVVTGTAPVTTITGTRGPGFTGIGQVPIVITPMPPEVITGTSKAPGITTLPRPSFTGVGLPVIIVLPEPQVTTTGYGPVPATIVVQPMPSGGTVGGPGGAATSYPVPTPTPGATPQPRPSVVPRPRPVNSPTRTTGSTTAPTITHNQAGQGPAPARVTATPGRQHTDQAPQFAARDGGAPWSCVASGHGRRNRTVNGVAQGSGTLNHVGSVDVLGRDLPALHPDHADCIVAVRRRRN